jgi:hypothetical protein
MQRVSEVRLVLHHACTYVMRDDVNKMHCYRAIHHCHLYVLTHLKPPELPANKMMSVQHFSTQNFQTKV